MIPSQLGKIGKITPLILAFLLVGAGLGRGADQLSVALVGDGYGKYEVEAIARDVMNELEDVCSYQTVEGKLDPKDFAQYGLVILARTVEPYTSEETGEIEKYVNDGGKLVLINVAPRSLFIVDLGPDDRAKRMRGDSFLFGSTNFEEGGQKTTVFQPESPLLKGVFEGGDDPFWMKGTVFLPNPHWENIIGHDQNILVGQTQLGKGTVYFLGSELFRLMKTAKDEGRPDDVQGWIQILKNLIRQAAAPAGT